jgi:hypothetical protein
LAKKVRRVRQQDPKNELTNWSIKMISVESHNISSKVFLMFVLGSLLAVGPLAVLALAQGDSSLWGSVSDATDAGVSGATVVIRNLEIGTKRTLTTDVSGHYNASALPVGHYEIAASMAGFQTDRRPLVSLVVGQREEVDFKLKVGEAHQTVEVPAVSTVVQIATEDDSGLVGERQVKDLPLNGRSYDQLLTLNPGIINYTSQRSGGIGTSNSAVGNMFAVSGRRPQENLFLLNGVEFTSASEINNTPGGTSGQLLGVDAVREFAVVKDTYGAEYGKRPGAQINIVTANGSNDFHGSAYEFLRNSALDARNFFDHGEVPHFERNVFGGSVGAPLVKDQTFLFANYEGFRQTLGVSDLTLVPDNASRASAVASIQPLLSLWPVANGPEVLTSTGSASGIAEAFGNPVQHIREDFGTLRFDQNVSKIDSFAAVYTVDDSDAHSPTNNPISFANIFLREHVVSLSETHIFSPSVVNRATLGFSRGAFYFNSGTTVDLPGWVNPKQPVGAVVVGGGTTLNGASQITNGGTNAGSNLTAARNLFTGEDQVTLTRGKHLLKFGVWLQRIQANDSLIQDQYGQVSFTNLQSFLQGKVSTYTYAPSKTPLGWRSMEGAFYAEDAIRVKPSLEVRIGFRAESTNGWKEVMGRASNYLFDANGVIITKPAVDASAFTKNNAKFLPAPRLGLAWSPFGAKKTVIRAGFGEYYALLDNLSYRLDQNAPFNSVYAVKNIAFWSIAPNPTYSGAKIIPSGVQPDLLIPTVESWSLKIEKQIAPNTSLGVSYIGSHGYHELLSVDANLPRATICPASPCPSGYPAGVLYYPPGATLQNNAVLNTTQWFSEGVSSYNGLEMDVNHHFSRGLQFRGVYTFSKALDDGDNMNTSVATNSPAFVANPLSPAGDYGRASFDVRHSGVVNATYDIPFSGSRKSDSGPWVERVFGNWQISAIETLQSGLPFTPQLSYNPSNDGDTRNPVRPSIKPSFAGAVIEGGPNQYFNANAFIQPLAGTYGNVGRNTLPGPSLVQTDVSAAKKFLFSEHLSLQFRAEIFNLFNRTNFNTPNPVVYAGASGGSSPTAGIITSTATSSRQLQFGLKLLW